ncbi:MAG: hypothetical protein AAFZ65_07365 [Planctomycetota bacterium]
MSTAAPSPTLHQILVLTPARDAEQRPLLESKSPLMGADELRAARVSCPFSESPSRHEHAKPMNEAALEQVRRHFGGFLGLFGDLCRRQRASTERETLGPEDWHRICLVGEVLPRLLLLRAFEADSPKRSLRDYFEPPLPIEVGIVFKTVRGLLRLTRVLLNDAPSVLSVLPAARRTALGFDAVSRHKPKKRSKQADRRSVWNAVEAKDAVRRAPWTAEDLLLVTERLELMVGDEEVCAAPQGMLLATFQVLVASDADQALPALDARVLEALDDFETLGSFADALEAVYAELDRFRGWNRAQTERLKVELDRLAPGATRTPLLERALDEYLLEERRFMGRLGILQREVLGAAGAAVVDPPLELGLVDDLVPDTPRQAAERHRGLRVDYTPDAIEIRRSGALIRSLPAE